MSTVYADYVNNLSGQRIVNNRGTILQCNFVRVDTITTFTFSYREQYENENSNFLPSLSLFNVENPNNIALIQWQICGEQGDQGDCGFYVLRNGSHINVTGGASGPNQMGGGTSGAYWSWNFGGFYDGNQGSTTNTKLFTYWGPIGITGDVTYSLRAVNTGGTTRTFYLNRSVLSAGQDLYENAVSCGVIYEISSDGTYK